MKASVSSVFQDQGGITATGISIGNMKCAHRSGGSGLSSGGSSDWMLLLPIHLRGEFMTKKTDAIGDSTVIAPSLTATSPDFLFMGISTGTLKKSQTVSVWWEKQQ
jgi:hypothetical protein